ncbi:MAG: hypothetical protein RIS08_857 [Actinomycetota bacterium]
MTLHKELNVFLRGGLGNQLFQYSTGLAISREQGRDLILRGDLLPEAEDSIGGVSRWPLQISEFHHTGRILTKINQPIGKTNSFGKSMQAMRILGDRAPWLVGKLGWLTSETGSDSDPQLNKPVRLINSYCPAKSIAFMNRGLLRQQVANVVNPSSAFNQLSEEIKEDKAIAVHLRQGDYLNLKHIYGSSSMSFLKNALEDQLDEALSRKIWLFTDTPSSTPKDLLEYLQPKRIIGPGDLSRPLENLVLMSQATAFVAANSSFSWWAAFLTAPGTPVIAPIIGPAKVNNFSPNSEFEPSWRIVNVS